MSFFDDEDDAIEGEPRRAARAGAPPRPRAGGSGGSRSGPPRRDSDPAIERRRWVAVAVIVVVVILMILLISSCQASDTKNSLLDYNNNVFQVIKRSDATGAQVFKALKSQTGSTLQSSLAAEKQQASAELTSAEDLGVPGQMAPAQRNVVLALRMRVDGIGQIAGNVGAATASTGGAAAAVAQIAGGTARFYASDVVYKDYAARDIAEALHGDSITVSADAGPGVAVINGGQFLDDLSWLQESYIETTLGATVSSGSSGTSGAAAGRDATAKCTGSPCVHGSIIESAAVGSNPMSTTGTNSVSGSPAPTFTLTFQNGGGYDEYGIGCKVTVADASVSGSGSTSATTPVSPGQTGTCTVKLSAPVPAGTYTVTATIEAVPGETVLSDNSETFQVQFS